MPVAKDVVEAFSGTSIVRWFNSIRFRLRNMIETEEANRNHEYASLIRTFLNTWETNAITGSINRETLEILKAAASPLSVMKWAPSSYFSGLVTSLDELIADQEQLPAMPTDQNAPFAGGAGFGSPPLTSEFGPEENMPEGGLEEPPVAPEGGAPEEGEGGAPPEGEEEIPIK